jgi:hypothetical protein
MPSFIFNLKRISVDLIALASVMLLIFFLPGRELAELNPKIGFLSIFLSKLIFISAGILHAHITRKLMWPYIDFDKDTNVVRRLMIIAWYTVVIWGWARGG